MSEEIIIDNTCGDKAGNCEFCGKPIIDHTWAERTAHNGGPTEEMRKGENRKLAAMVLGAPCVCGKKKIGEHTIGEFRACRLEMRKKHRACSEHYRRRLVASK